MMESEAFNYLDAPVERVTAWDIPLAYSVMMERSTLPQKENIIKAVKRTMKGVKL
jgi:pyruvate dehydrogenase E1 component beta subunit